MAEKNLKEWQILRKKLLENYFFYRGGCEIDGIAVWPKNMGEHVGVSERIAEYWLKGKYIPTKRHITKIRTYCERLKPLPEFSAEIKEYQQELLKSAEGILQTLKLED